MKILFLSVGKKHDAALAEAITDFTSRISHYAPVEWKLIPSGDSVDTEGKSILNALDERDQVVLLDEKGKELHSSGLAGLLDTRLNASTHRLVFIIGGAYGVNESVRARANAMVALSKLTFPHMLVRLILAEQVYRAFTILKGEKYHHS
jgi:23S rRNA (pseudouridine1915-N3)-methyltransferase